MEKIKLIRKYRLKRMSGYYLRNSMDTILDDAAITKSKRIYQYIMSVSVYSNWYAFDVILSYLKVFRYDKIIDNFIRKAVESYHLNIHNFMKISE